ncbi:hypothetical protein Hanom_Chr00s004264g01721121 [Helianthus anomalus]
MIPRGRGKSSSYGRSQTSSYRGRGHNSASNNRQDMVLAQIGNRRLIASNIASSSNEVISSSNTGDIQIDQNDPLYEKIMDLIKAQKEKEITKPPTYATTVQDNDEDDSWFITERQKKIIILNQEDIKLLDDPWVLMQKYLDPASYDATSYKTRQYFENILQLTETAEIRHFYPSDREKHMYNFSKIFIKSIIPPQKWGLSTLKEREFIYPETNNRQTYKYNYWDYIQSFEKCLFYENSKKKHSWFIKVSDNVFKQGIPCWFQKWFLLYGPTVQILPEPFKSLYTEWVRVSPDLIEANYNNTWFEGIASMYFFIEFSIPWIWKWKPTTGYTLRDNFPCLKRTCYTKFWNKMIQTKESTKLIEAQETVNLINTKIEQYKLQIAKKQQRQLPSPWEQISRRLITEKQDVSKDEIIKSYMEEMKREIKKHFSTESSSKAMSISSNSQEDYNQFSCLAGEGQDTEEIDDKNLDTQINEYLEKMKEEFGELQEDPQEQSSQIKTDKEKEDKKKKKI